jgi:DNA-binding IscR family transcriptional regulator
VEGSLEPVACVNANSDCPIKETCISTHTWSELYHEINECVNSINLTDLVDAYYAMDKMEYAI